MAVEIAEVYRIKVKAFLYCKPLHTLPVCLWVFQDIFYTQTYPNMWVLFCFLIASCIIGCCISQSK